MPITYDVRYGKSFIILVPCSHPDHNWKKRSQIRQVRIDGVSIAFLSRKKHCTMTIGPMRSNQFLLKHEIYQYYRPLRASKFIKYLKAFITFLGNSKMSEARKIGHFYKKCFVSRNGLAF